MKQFVKKLRSMSPSIGMTEAASRGSRMEGQGLESLSTQALMSPEVSWE